MTCFCQNTFFIEPSWASSPSWLAVRASSQSSSPWLGWRCGLLRNLHLHCVPSLPQRPERSLALVPHRKPRLGLRILEHQRVHVPISFPLPVGLSFDFREGHVLTEHASLPIASRALVTMDVLQLNPGHKLERGSLTTPWGRAPGDGFGRRPPLCR